jgi:hypothetical protein
MKEDTLLRRLPTSDVVQGLEGTLKHLQYMKGHKYPDEVQYLVRCAQFGVESRLEELYRRRAMSQYKQWRREYVNRFVLNQL